MLVTTAITEERFTIEGKPICELWNHLLRHISWNSLNNLPIRQEALGRKKKRKVKFRHILNIKINSHVIIKYFIYNIWNMLCRYFRIFFSENKIFCLMGRTLPKLWVIYWSSIVSGNTIGTPRRCVSELYNDHVNSEYDHKYGIRLYTDNAKWFLYANLKR